MARAKDRTAAPAKTAKSAAPTARNTAKKPSPDAPGARSAEQQHSGSRTPPTPEQLYRMIQETAYYKAKARNFQPGNEVQDWIEAEAEVRQRIDSRA